VVELADTPDLGSGAAGIRVQVPSLAKYPPIDTFQGIFYTFISPIFLVNAVLAHLVEHLTCNHEVSGSIPEDG
jgi:hypothetical protein